MWTLTGQAWEEQNTGGGVMAQVAVLPCGAVVAVSDEGVGLYADAAHWQGETVGPWGDGQPLAWIDTPPMGNDVAPSRESVQDAADALVQDAPDALRLAARARLWTQALGVHAPDALTLDAHAPRIVYAMGRAALAGPVTATLCSGYVTLTRR